MIYRNAPSAETLAEVDKTLQFIRKYAPELTEQAGTSKWTDGHTVFFDPATTPDQFVFMVGALKNGKVTWHLMPMYGVPELKERWTEALKPFASGKSCIHFRQFNELPQDALQDIVKHGAPRFSEIVREMKKNKRRR